MPRIPDRFLVVIQMFALGAILLASMIAARESPLSARRAISSESESSSVNFSGSAAAKNRRLRPETITSRVFVLPFPLILAQGMPLPLEVEVATRQLRFEKTLLSSSTQPPRTIASKRRPSSMEEWKLVGIQKKLSSGWEEVQLIHNDRDQALGSVFVELSDGVNEFQVTFKNAAGQITSYPVKVRHVRKNTT